MMSYKSEKASAEVIGHVILLGLTLTGTALMLLFGLPVINTLQDMIDVKNAEQIFTMVDSRASQVILGDSPMKMVDINLGGGALAVQPNGTGKESYMVIRSKNNTFNITIPMGKLEYRLGERTIAYEGGGIWSKYPTGASVMLSPPEFHYNGVTLSLPEVNITGNGSAGGKGAVRATFRKLGTRTLYPNASFPNRTNPLNYTVSGKVYVNITSDFYDAWAEFAKNLIYTVVTTNPATRTASIELTVVPSTFGGNTSIINPINMRGIPPDDTPLDNFSFKIRPSGNNLKWDIRAKAGNKSLIFFLVDSTSWNNPSDKVELEIAYRDGTNVGETWGEAEFAIQPDQYTYVDMLNKNMNLTYENENVGADNANQCQPFGRKISGLSDPDYSWDGIVINATNNNKQSIYNVTQHYISKLAQEGEVSFYQCSPSNQGNQAPDSDSTMLLNYKATGALTYLHISENRVEVII